MQSDFSEIVKLGLGDPPQYGNEVQRYRIDDAVVADVLVFLGIANLQISAVSREWDKRHESDTRKESDTGTRPEHIDQTDFAGNPVSRKGSTFDLRIELNDVRKHEIAKKDWAQDHVRNQNQPVSLPYTRDKLEFVSFGM